MNALPSVVTHTYNPRPGPFLNLCYLDDGAAEAVLTQIRAIYGRNRNPAYLEKRRATEDWLQRERAGKGIRGNLTRPIYFFLGDYDDGLDPARPAAIVLPLTAFPADTVTFTLNDSMACFSAMTASGDQSPQLYTRTELENSFPLALRAGAEAWPMGSAPPGTTMPSHRTGFVEVQVWDDTPLRTLCPEFFAA